MGMDRRRTGFRLSWTANDNQGDDKAQPDEAVGDATPAAAVDTLTADAPNGDEPMATEAAASEAAPEPAAEAATETAAAGDTSAASMPDGESSEFLVSLVGAMRGVAESSRDASMAELRTTVDAHIEKLNTSAAEKEAELRRAADLDLTGVGDWEHDEIERIKGEAETRRDARRTKLDQQLADHRSASERDVQAARTRLSDHERELAAFFAQLGEISDPAAFVAAAKRMPRPPELNSTPPPASPVEKETETSAEVDPRLAAMGMTDQSAVDGTETSAESGTQAADMEDAATPPDADTDNRLAARLAQLDERIAGGTQPVTAAPAPVQSNGGEASTAVIVKGLGSFGAITSFKQALERVDGVRGVTLSLGPTGEFVYRASHAAEFDMATAVQSVEGPSATVEDVDGTLVVTLSRAR